MFEGFVLAAATGDLDDEPAARAHADAVEFRMDLAAADPLAQLADYDGELPLIVTNRPRWEGGETSPDGRLDTLAAALDADAVRAVDVELATLRGGAVGDNDASVTELCERIGATDTHLIASVHDFDGTPDAETLTRLTRAASRAGDVGKLAVTAHEPADALRVLTATHRATARGDRVATMAMGAAGSHTRAVAPVYGSRIGYAPVDPADATAPGQFDLATLRELVDQLESGVV